MANTDRTALRSALTRHTDGKLTNNTDLDFYINKAEVDVFREWRKFDPGAFRGALESVTSDANGIILLEQAFTRLEYLEDTNHRQYYIFTNMSRVPFYTGFYFQGYDQTNNKRQIKVILNGVAVASTVFQWYNIERLAMGAAGNAESAIPEEHRSLISVRAAYLYFRDKGPAFIVAKDDWHTTYKEELNDARKWYENVDKSPQYVDSVEPDTGTSRNRLQQFLP